MYIPDDRDYYSARAVTSREMAQRATNPDIAAIHAELANRYEFLAYQPEPEPDTMTMAVQAT